MRSNVNFGMVRGRSSEQNHSFQGRSPVTRHAPIFRIPILGEINYIQESNLRSPFSRASSQTPGSRDHFSWTRPTHHFRESETLSKRQTESNENYRMTPTMDLENHKTLLIEIHRLEGIIQENRNLAELWRVKEVELEKRIKLLIEENERLSGLVDHYSNEAEVFKMKLIEAAGNFTLTGDLSNQKQDQEIDNKRLINSRRRSIDDRLIRSSGKKSNEMRFGDFGGTLEERKKELEEVEKKALIAVESQTQEIEKWKIAYERLEIKFVELQRECNKLTDFNENLKKGNDLMLSSDEKIELKELNGTKEKFYLLLGESERLQKLVEELQNERGVFFKRLAELEGARFQIGSLEEKILLLAAENERLGGCLGKKYPQPSMAQTNLEQGEREMLIKRISELETLVQSTLELKDKVILLADQNESLNNETKRKSLEIEHLMKQLLEKQNKNNNTFNDLEEQTRILMMEKDNLQKALFEKEEESRLWKSRYFEIEEQNISFNGELARYIKLFKDAQKKIEVLNSQKENFSILEKQREVVENLPKQSGPPPEINNLKKNINLLVKENGRLNSAIEQNLSQIEVLQNKCNQYEDEKFFNKESQDIFKLDRVDQEGKMKLLISENIQIKQEFEEQNEKFKLLITEKSQLQNTLKSFLNLKNQNDGLEEKINFLASENSQLQNEMKILLQLKQEKEMFEEKAIKLNDENQQLSHHVTQSRIQSKQQKDEFENKISLLLMENEELNYQIELKKILEKEKMESEEVIKNLKNENIHLRKLIETTENQVTRENEELKEKTQNLTRELSQLSNLKKSYSRIQCQNEELEEKNKFLILENINLQKENNLHNSINHEKERHEQQIERLVLENKQINTNLSQMSVMAQHRQEELEEKIKLLISENMKFNQEQELYIKLDEEIRETKKKLLLLATENQRLLNETEILLKVKKEKFALDEKIQSLIFENNQLHIKIQSLSSIQIQKEQLEEKLKNLISENIKLHHNIEFESVQNREKEEIEEKIKKLRIENLQLQQSAVEKMQQIDEMQNKCYNLENEKFKFESSCRKLGHLEKEIERLNKLLKEKEIIEEKVNLVIMENEQLNKVTTNQKTIIDEYEIQIARIENENTRKRSESFVIKEELENQVNLKEVEILQLKGIIQQSQNQFNDLQEKYKNLDSENSVLRQNENHLTNQNETLTEKVIRLTSEERRLQTLIHDKTKKFENIQMKFIELEFENNKLKLLERDQKVFVQERERMQNIFRENENEKENFRSELANQKKEIDSLSGLKKKIELLTSENERLEEFLGDLQNKIEDWEQRYKEQGAKLVNLEDTNLKITVLNREEEELKKEIIKTQDEKEKWRNKYLGLKDENDVLQNKLGLLTKENSYLVNSNNQKTEEINGLRMIISQQQDLKSKTIELQGKLNNVIEENKVLNKTLDSELKEFDRNRGIIEEDLYSKELVTHELKLQVQNLLQQNMKFETKIVELNEDIINWKIKYEQAEKAYTKITVLEQRLLTLATENERLNKELGARNKVDELEKGEIIINTLRNDIRELTTENGSLKRKNSLLKDDLQRSQEKLKNWNNNEKLLNKSPTLSQNIFERPQQIEESKKASSGNNELVSHIHDLNEEKERLENTNSDLIKELEFWKEKCISAEKEYLKPKVPKSPESKFGQLIRENSELIQKINMNSIPIETINAGSNLKKPMLFDNLQPSNSKEIKEVTSERIVIYEKSPQFEDKESEEEEDNDEELSLDALDNEERMGLLIEEVEKLERKIIQKNKVISLLRSRITDLENYEKENQEIKHQLEISFTENRKLNMMLENQKKGLNEKFGNSVSKNSCFEFDDNNEYEDELSTKVITLNTEVERLNRLINERDQEIENLKPKNFKSQNKFHFEMRIKFLENENEKLHNQLLIKIQETENLKTHLNNENQKLSKAKLNHEVLSDSNEMKIKSTHYNEDSVSGVVKQLEEIIVHLQKRNKELEMSLKDKSEELNIFKFKTNNKESDFDNTNHVVENLKLQIVLLCSEIERLTFLLQH